MYTPSLHLLSQASTVLRVYRTSCIPFGFLSRFLGLVPIPFRENAGSQLFCTKSLSKTSPGSRTGGCHDALTIAVAAVLPAVSRKNIGHFQPHHNFPAQSLHFRSGSVFPCPTLKSGVTASIPRTRYGRLVRPYPVRFSHSISSAYQYKQMWYPARKGKSAMLISQLALQRYDTTCRS